LSSFYFLSLSFFLLPTLVVWGMNLFFFRFWRSLLDFLADRGWFRFSKNLYDEQ
jgi:hypothetical protein